MNNLKITVVGLGYVGMSLSVLLAQQNHATVLDINPERDGNRMTAEVLTKKTEELNWQPKHDIKEYIKTLKKNN